MAHTVFGDQKLQQFKINTHRPIVIATDARGTNVYRKKNGVRTTPISMSRLFSHVASLVPSLDADVVVLVECIKTIAAPFSDLIGTRFGLLIFVFWLCSIVFVYWQKRVMTIREAIGSLSKGKKGHGICGVGQVSKNVWQVAIDVVRCYFGHYNNSISCKLIF